MSLLRQQLCMFAVGTKERWHSSQLSRWFTIWCVVESLWEKMETEKWGNAVVLTKAATPLPTANVSLKSTGDDKLHLHRTTNEDKGVKPKKGSSQSGWLWIRRDGEAKGRRSKRPRWVWLENEPLFSTYLPDGLKPPVLNTPVCPSQCPAASVPHPAHTSCEIRPFPPLPNPTDDKLPAAKLCSEISAAANSFQYFPPLRDKAACWSPLFNYSHTRFRSCRWKTGAVLSYKSRWGFYCECQAWSAVAKYI